MEFVTGVAILCELEKVLNKRLGNSFGGNGKRVQKSEKIGKSKRKKKHPNLIQTIQTQILLHKFFENWLFRLVLHMP